jgi:hypothetical protein
MTRANIAILLFAVVSTGFPTGEAFAQAATANVAPADQGGGGGGAGGGGYSNYNVAPADRGGGGSNDGRYRNYNVAPADRGGGGGDYRGGGAYVGGPSWEAPLGYYDDDDYQGGYVAVAPGPGISVQSCRGFRSYDPGSRTYRGYDGRRHPCP